MSSRPAGGVAWAPKREWSYRGRATPDGRGFDSPQLHHSLRRAPGRAVEV